VQEVAESLSLVLDRHPEYRTSKILERIIEPERSLCSVSHGSTIKAKYMSIVDTAFNEQCHWPYKGGLRFHPSVTLGILKFLAFEQVFKNSLQRSRWVAAKAVLILILKEKVT